MMNDRQTGKQTWLSVISNMLQFILGFLLGVTLIAGSAAGVAFYYFKKMSSTVPEKPVYTEETNPATQEATEVPEEEAGETTTTEEAKDNSEQIPVNSPVAEEIPEGAYYANVTWPQGLSLRAEPSPNAARIGGVGYDAEILILEETADKKWQRIQVPWSKQEGWVKGGNTKRTSY